MDKINYKMISYICILSIICICSFLAAKYVIRMNIDKGDIPVDTSTRIE